MTTLTSITKVNNAGVCENQPLAKVTLEAYNAMVRNTLANLMCNSFDDPLPFCKFDINCRAPLFLTKAVSPHLPRGGRIINVSSVTARIGGHTQTVYGGSKAAVEAFTRTWATELRAQGVNVTAVNPGPVETDMWAAVSDDIKRHVTEAHTPIGKPQQIADVVAFLASERSEWVNGSVVSPIDPYSGNNSMLNDALILRSMRTVVSITIECWRS